jgi:hypothetical protein
VNPLHLLNSRPAPIETNVSLVNPPGDDLPDAPMGESQRGGLYDPRVASERATLRRIACTPISHRGENHYQET